MPELPEVETTRRGLLPLICGRRLLRIDIRESRLRWPVDQALCAQFHGRPLTGLRRRGKYLIFDCSPGSLIVHLGMSGSLLCVPADQPALRHEHLDLVLDDGHSLRLRDPRRFGALLATEADPLQHPLLSRLGQEPLGAGFDGPCLYRLTRKRHSPVKTVIMDAHSIVGIGNIYASEALYRARLAPSRMAASLNEAECDCLAAAIRQTLEQALAAGGTTLRDFCASDGRPGYFQLQTSVYGRAGQPCPNCGGPIENKRIGQRSTFFCPNCQPDA